LSLWQALFLGLIQGLTEFLPVSSSGHLVIFQNILGVETGAGVLFDVMVHTGTLAAVVVVFWEDIWNVIRKPNQKLTWLLFVGIIPAGLMGFFLEDFFTKMFSSVLVVGAALLVTGAFLWYADSIPRGGKGLNKLTTGQALFIGVAQGLAIIPGLSRSGTTITAALAMGMDRESAARYSFLVSVPVIFGAALLHVKDLLGTGIQGVPIMNYVAAMLVSAVSGYLAIKFLLKLLAVGRLKVFSIYVWVLGLVVITVKLT